MKVEQLPGLPITYLIRMRTIDGDAEVALVRARWVRADDTAVWWCCRCRSILCDDVRMVEGYRELHGLPRSPV